MFNNKSLTRNQKLHILHQYSHTERIYFKKSFCLQTNKVKQTITAVSHAIMLTAVILFTQIIFSSA